MKKLISLLLSLVMVLALCVPAFAATGYYYAESWDDLVGYLAALNDGDDVLIEIAPDDEYNNIHANGRTAYISASNVNITFNKKIDFEVDDEQTDPIFSIGGKNVTIDFGTSQLRSNVNAAVMVDGDACTIEYARFHCCKNPGGWGGGIWITNEDPDCRVIGCTFYKCEAKYGGGIYIDSDNATIDGCHFENCKCSKEGPDVYDNNEDSTIKNSDTTIPKYYNPFAYVRVIDNCTFGAGGMGFAVSGGNIWIIAGVAVVMIAAAAVVAVIVKKKKKIEQ